MDQEIKKKWISELRSNKYAISYTNLVQFRSCCGGRRWTKPGYSALGILLLCLSIPLSGVDTNAKRIPEDIREKVGLTIDQENYIIGLHLEGFGHHDVANWIEGNC